MGLLRLFCSVLDAVLCSLPYDAYRLARLPASGGCGWSASARGRLGIRSAMRLLSYCYTISIPSQGELPSSMFHGLAGAVMEAIAVKRQAGLLDVAAGGIRFGTLQLCAILNWRCSTHTYCTRRHDNAVLKVKRWYWK